MGSEPNASQRRAIPDAEATPAGRPAGAAPVRLGMESISDVVFGLALSIGSVILLSTLPQSTNDLANDVFWFGFNFLIVIIVWIGYRRAVVTLPHETQATVVANLALLFVVSLEPFLFWVMVSDPPLLEPASVAYALDVGSMILLQSGFGYLLLLEERATPRGGIAPSLLEGTRRRIRYGAAVGALFLVSSLPFFWVPVPGGTTLRIDLWWIGLVLILVFPRLPVRGGSRMRPPR